MGTKKRSDAEILRAEVEALTHECINWIQNYIDLKDELETLKKELDSIKSQQPVAWRWLYDGSPDSGRCFPMPGPDADVVSRAEQSAFPRTVQYLFCHPYISTKDKS